MPQIQLADKIFEAASRKAADAGFSSVDEYIADVVNHDLEDEMESLDHLFTPERLAHIDRAVEEYRSGNFYTLEQADSELAKRRAEWIQKNKR